MTHRLPRGIGGPDVNKGAKYILWRFTQLNRARLSIYPHLTQATDTSNVRPLPLYFLIPKIILTSRLLALSDKASV